MMVNYLHDCNHPGTDVVERLDPYVLNADCGVFTMRHMETYMGGRVNGRLTGLAAESL